MTDKLWDDSQMHSFEDLASRLGRQSPTPEDLSAMESIRSSAIGFGFVLIDLTKPSREQSLALTALEEAKYWANQALARHHVYQPYKTVQEDQK